MALRDMADLFLALRPDCWGSLVLQRPLNAWLSLLVISLPDPGGVLHCPFYGISPERHPGTGPAGTCRTPITPVPSPLWPFSVSLKNEFPK